VARVTWGVLSGAIDYSRDQGIESLCWGGEVVAWELCKMEATLGPVYTAQQMAAGAAARLAIVKIFPRVRGSSAR
jgi:hypothetical protein